MRVDEELNYLCQCRGFYPDIVNTVQINNSHENKAVFAAMNILNIL